MRIIPPKQREEMEQMPFFKVCALAGHNQGECAGEITWDHPVRFGGPQVIDPNWTVPLCARHHNVNDYQDNKSYDRNLSLWVVLNRATDAEIKYYSKVEPYLRHKARLNALYGPYNELKAISAYIHRKPEPKSATGSIRSPHQFQSKDKKFWVPLSLEQRKKVQACIDYYADIYDKYYSPFEMVDKMINSCYDVLPQKVDKTSKESINYGGKTEERAP